MPTRTSPAVTADIRTSGRAVGNATTSSCRDTEHVERLARHRRGSRFQHGERRRVDGIAVTSAPFSWHRYRPQTWWMYAEFACDEDRCRACVRHLPRNLSCLTNVAIAIVRCDGRFRYLPEANRHYAVRAQEALDAITVAPVA